MSMLNSIMDPNSFRRQWGRPMQDSGPPQFTSPVIPQVDAAAQPQQAPVQGQGGIPEQMFGGKQPAAPVMDAPPVAAAPAGDEGAGGMLGSIMKMFGGGGGGAAGGAGQGAAMTSGFDPAQLAQMAMMFI